MNHDSNGPKGGRYCFDMVKGQSQVPGRVRLDVSLQYTTEHDTRVNACQDLRWLTI